ncbi:hypothetical protein RF11_05013 [Thelohanellus kitauei]|uniref:Uncharacterized protein n=1 Tax=Thelohanellus kitauei TaxID=669202 RepID=A0A0C2I9B4_THEKT|nr:hypothetical protein RF11_05013 [Thelohanellus kitauei]
MSEQEIHTIFTGIPIESIFHTNDNKWRVSFSANNFEAARQPSYIEVVNEEVYEIISEKCSLMNIPLTVDESKRHIYPQFSSFHDLDLLTYYLFTNEDIYPEKASFHPGDEIRKLFMNK